MRITTNDCTFVGELVGAYSDGRVLYLNVDDQVLDIRTNDVVQVELLTERNV